jgi:signal transduction histidine kinase
MLNNLLDNALKYSDAGSEVIVKTQISANDGAVVEVCDSGAPIREGDKPHIFKKHFRGDNLRGISGNGLGLFLAMRIVEAHRGSLRLEEGVGATKSFVVELPPAWSDTAAKDESLQGEQQT